MSAVIKGCSKEVRPFSEVNRYKETNAKSQIRQRRKIYVRTVEVEFIRGVPECW